MANRNNVVKYKKPIHINLGSILFIIVFIYLAIQVIMFFNSEQLSVYEVTQNKIADDNTYLGFILRDETIVTNKSAGYINYYVGEGERIANKSTVYTLDQTGEMYKVLTGTEQEEKLSENDIAEIRKTIAALQKNYSGGLYSSVYSYKYDIENTMLELSNINVLDTLNKVLSSSGKDNSFQVVKSNKSGIVSYIQDGFEGMTVDDITESIFDTSTYKKTQLRTTELKEVNSPIYKLVNSESWSIVIQLTDQQYESLKEKKTVRVTFLEDKQQANASISFVEKEGKRYGVLQLSNFMLRYLSDRYINIEIVANSATGYKVPRSAITEKEYYKIPLRFFTKGGDNNKNGVVKLSYAENGQASTQFIETSIFYQDDNYGYIDTSLLKKDDIIINPESANIKQEKFQVSETSPIRGVYNVNKGYPVFKRIEVIYENSEYSLLKMDTKNGLNNFDHIILNVSLAKELDYVE